MQFLQQERMQKYNVYDTTIKTTGESSSRGLDSTYGGYIEADNVTISTEGESCATLATDRGEGTVIAKNSVLSTKGAGSPVIYSTGDISIENTKGNIEVDNISILEMNLKQGSKLETTINSANTAKSITLNIDSTSTLTLTGDCYVTSLTDEDTSYSNINFNGYKLYVNGTAIN